MTPFFGCISCEDTRKGLQVNAIFESETFILLMYYIQYSYLGASVKSLLPSYGTLAIQKISISNNFLLFPQAIDFDKDGKIDWYEFTLYLKWAIVQYPEEIKTVDDLVKITFTRGLIPSMQDEILGRAYQSANLDQ